MVIPDREDWHRSLQPLESWLGGQLGVFATHHLRIPRVQIDVVPEEDEKVGPGREDGVPDRLWLVAPGTRSEGDTGQGLAGGGMRVRLGPDRPGDQSGTDCPSHQATS